MDGSRPLHRQQQTPAPVLLDSPHKNPPEKPCGADNSQPRQKRTAASASAVEIAGAKIVLVDIDPQTMIIDYDALENAITPRTRAVIPVSIFGNPVDYDLLKDVPGVTIPREYPKAKHSSKSCCIFVSDRDQVMEDLAKQGIASRIRTYSLHMHKAFNQNKNCDIKGTMPGSKYAFNDKTTS